MAVPLGLFLHFFISFLLAATYVFAAGRVTVLKTRPVLYGIAYGLVAYLVMTKIVVPLSPAQFGSETPTPVQLAQSLFIHLSCSACPSLWQPVASVVE